MYHVTVRVVVFDVLFYHQPTQTDRLLAEGHDGKRRKSPPAAAAGQETAERHHFLPEQRQECGSREERQEEEEEPPPAATGRGQRSLWWCWWWWGRAIGGSPFSPLPWRRQPGRKHFQLRERVCVSAKSLSLRSRSRADERPARARARACGWTTGTANGSSHTYLPGLSGGGAAAVA